MCVLVLQRYYWLTHKTKQKTQRVPLKYSKNQQMFCEGENVSISFVRPQRVKQFVMVTNSECKPNFLCLKLHRARAGSYVHDIMIKTII